MTSATGKPNINRASVRGISMRMRASASLSLPQCRAGQMHAVGAAILIGGFPFHLRKADEFATAVAWTPFAVPSVDLLRRLRREPPSDEVRYKTLPHFMGERHDAVAAEPTFAMPTRDARVFG